MKNKNIAILLIAIVVVVGAATFFLKGMGNHQSANLPADAAPQESVDEDSSEPGIQPARVVGVDVGNIAPDFTLADLTGEQVSLSDFSGKHVFLNFWATWCKFCDQEMPDLQKLYIENDDMAVLAVNIMEKNGEVSDYVTNNGLEFPVVLDENGSIGTKFMVSGMPTTYFIDKEGMILGYYPGMMTYEQMDDVLRQMRELED